MRVYDAAILNEIANHPKVVRNLEWNPDHGMLTVGNLLADPDKFVLLANDTGELAMIFEWSSPGVWQVHTMSVPSIWGNTVGDAKKLFHEMFTEWGAKTIWGQTPLHNVIARKFNLKVGAVSQGIGHHHVAGEVEYFENSRAQWLADHWSG